MSVLNYRGIQNAIIYAWVESSILCSSLEAGDTCIVCGPDFCHTTRRMKTQGIRLKDFIYTPVAISDLIESFEIHTELKTGNREITGTEIAS